MWFTPALVGAYFGAALVLLISGAWFIHTSAWFMWGIVQAQASPTVFVDEPPLIQAIVSDIGQRYHLPANIPFELSAVRRFAWGRGETAPLLVFIPRLGQGEAVRRHLHDQGWALRRLGSLLIASPASLPSTPDLLQRGTREFARHLAFDALPLQPEALLRISPHTVSVLPEGLRAVAVAQRRGVTVIGRSRDAWPIFRVNTPAEPSPHGLAVTLPGARLAGLPADAVERWQKDLVARLSLDTSMPRLEQALAPYASVTLATDGATGVIAAVGSPDAFAQLTATWVSAEQGYRTPATAAFRLPDGTLGYEKRPSEVKLAWPPAGQDGCHYLALPFQNYWLCRVGEASAFGTNPRLAQATLAQLPPTGSWRARFGADFLDKLISSPFTTLEVASLADDQFLLRAY